MGDETCGFLLRWLQLEPLAVFASLHGPFLEQYGGLKVGALFANHQILKNISQNDPYVIRHVDPHVLSQSLHK